MDLNMKAAIEMLSAALKTTQGLAPIAAQLGIPGVSQLAPAAGVAAKIGLKLLDLIEKGQVVASTEDQAQIRALTDALAAENDGLAARIDES